MVRFAGGAAASLSGAATLPKGRPAQVDLRVFGSEGMLLLDIERERLELRRRDGNDEVILMKAGDGAYVCQEPLRVFVDLCLGRKTENSARPRRAAPWRSLARCTAPQKADAWRRSDGRSNSRCSATRQPG